jgi:hypothetical protein
LVVTGHPRAFGGNLFFAKKKKEIGRGGYEEGADNGLKCFAQVEETRTRLAISFAR